MFLLNSQNIIKLLLKIGLKISHECFTFQCVIDGKFARPQDACIRNPKNCNRGLSFSIWEKVFYSRKLIDFHPDDAAFDKQYIFSTGGDYDAVLGQSVPGFALYHKGLDMVAVVSTGEDVWELQVRGQLINETWTSYGIIWSMPDLDETKTMHPTSRGGLQMFVNKEKVGHSVLPIDRPAAGTWDELPAVGIPARDPAGNPIGTAQEGPPVMMFGCHYEQMEDGAAVGPGFDHFHEAVFDEMAIWTRELKINKTHDESLYFLGGYVKDLEEMSAAKFSEMLASVDMTDPDQAAAAGAMTGMLLSNQKEEQPAAQGSNNPATQPTPSGSSNTGGGLAAAQSAAGSHQLSWKEQKKVQQMKLSETYAQLLSTDGALDGALPKHLDKRFANIPTAAKMLSCSPDNIERWKILQEDNNLGGSSEYVEKLENYALTFMSASNISFYDNTDFFNSETGEYIVHLSSDEMYMSVQKTSRNERA